MLRLVFPVLLVLAAAAAWGACLYGKGKVVDELVAASQGNDAAAFAARVDWEGLRAFLKEDLAAQKKSPIGASMGPDAGRIGAIVDYFIQPENVGILYYWHDEVFKGIPERDFIHASGFAPPFGFYVTLALPDAALQENAQARAFRDRMKVRAVFRLDGLTWKVRELHVPLFMVPRHVYNVPAIDVYGPPGKR